MPLRRGHLGSDMGHIARNPDGLVRWLEVCPIPRSDPMCVDSQRQRLPRVDELRLLAQPPLAPARQRRLSARWAIRDWMWGNRDKLLERCREPVGCDPDVHGEHGIHQGFGYFTEHGAALGGGGTASAL